MTAPSKNKPAVRTPPSPAILHQLSEVLTRQVALLIDMILLGASRIYHPSVFLAEAETASTNGSLWIRMPIDFLGLHYPTERVAAAPVWLGLLAHEFGHWLQPLDEMTKTGKELRVPHWLVNILLDIHGEALVAGLFGGLHGPLKAKRTHIGGVMAKAYKRHIREAETFLDALQSLALYYRFCCDPGRSYVSSQTAMPPRLFKKLNPTIAGRVRACAVSLGEITGTPTRDLPDFLRKLVCEYPELVLPPGEDPGDGDGGGLEHGGSSTSSGGSMLPVLRRMINDGLPAIPAEVAQEYATKFNERIGQVLGPQPPNQEAARLSNLLAVRFHTPKGMLSVPAPGRLDRIAALHQDPVPFRLELPSRFSGQPSPKVVLYVDRSESMAHDKKWEHAKLAAQSIALAIRRAGGDVRVVVFDIDFYHTQDYSADALFASSLAGVSMLKADGDDTSFAWLPKVWMQFPDYVHILLTDGCGSLPLLISERDRRRTFAIVIPQGSPERVAPLAAKVVVVKDLRRLPGVFAFLAPRQWVG